MNAVFERDYVRTSVSRRYLWMRGGFAVVVAGLVLFLCAGAFATSDFDGVGVGVLRAVVWTGFVLLLVAAPGTFGTSLVHARAQNALPILLASPLRPVQVASGAFLARCAGLAVFVFACWPPVAIALSFGGVELPRMGVATAALLGSLLLVAAPAFVISAFARATGPAVVAAYLSAASLLAGLGALGETLLATDPQLARSISPVHAVVGAVEPSLAAAPGRDGGLVLLVLGAAAGLAATLLAAWRLHREASGLVESVASQAAARGYRPLLRANPILDRELRTGGSLRSRSAGRSLTIALVASEIAYLAAVWKLGLATSIPLFGGFLAFQTVLLVLAAAAAGATSLAAEKESGQFEAIRVTPISPHEIVEGKLLGLLRALAPALLVPCAHLAWGVVAGILHPLAVPGYLVAGAVVSATWVVIGMSQSLDQRDPHRAVVRTMGLLGIVGFLLAGYLGFVAYAALDSVDRWIRAPISFGANPAGAILGYVAAARVGGSDAESTSVPPPTPGQVTAALVVGTLWLLVHAGAAVLVRRSLVRIYRTRFEG